MTKISPEGNSNSNYVTTPGENYNKEYTKVLEILAIGKCEINSIAVVQCATLAQ